MKYLITGGAGFIGCNLAERLLRNGEEVIVFDNLSRLGTDKNIKWLKDQFKFKFFKEDITNFIRLKKIIKDIGNIDVIFHLVAQVAVTTSILNPRADFETNLLGAINILEAIRENNINPIIIYASTNKVYGKIDSVEIIEKKSRYEFKNLKNGISESFPIDLYSPYGCSKGAAEQYFKDYSRIYGLKTICFRQSCIYGPRQFGNEDQGWVAWFIIAAMMNRPITIYGTGKQVRDILYIDDLIDLFLISIDKIDIANGNVYNIGGGPNHTISLIELINFLEKIFKKRIKIEFSDERPGDQCIFISNLKKVKDELNWEPKVNLKNGIEYLVKWVKNNKSILI